MKLVLSARLVACSGDSCIIQESSQKSVYFSNPFKVVVVFLKKLDGETTLEWMQILSKTNEERPRFKQVALHVLYKATVLSVDDYKNTL